MSNYNQNMMESSATTTTNLTSGSTVIGATTGAAVSSATTAGTTVASAGMTESVTGGDSATTPLKFHLQMVESSRSHKTSPVWAYFSHFDLLHHQQMKYHRICLVCCEKGADKAISLGKISRQRHLSPICEHTMKNIQSTYC
jgi:hypothetical protein